MRQLLRVVPACAPRAAVLGAQAEPVPPQELHLAVEVVVGQPRGPLHVVEGLSRRVHAPQRAAPVEQLRPREAVVAAQQRREAAPRRPAGSVAGREQGGGGRAPPRLPAHRVGQPPGQAVVGGAQRLRNVSRAPVPKGHGHLPRHLVIVLAAVRVLRANEDGERGARWQERQGLRGVAPRGIGAHEHNVRDRELPLKGEGLVHRHEPAPKGEPRHILQQPQLAQHHARAKPQAVRRHHEGGHCKGHAKGGREA